MPKRFRDLVGVSVNEDEAVGEPASGVVELLGMSCAADSNYSINILTQRLQQTFEIRVNLSFSNSEIHDF